MIFEITDEVCEDINENSSIVSEMFQELLHARRNGRHIIYAKPETIRNLSKLPGLSKQVKALADQLQTQVRGKKKIYDNAKAIVQIKKINTGIRNLEIDGKLVIQIPCEVAVDDDLYMTPYLITENETDGGIYLRLAEIVSTYKKIEIPKAAKNSFELIPGGGSQTPRTYKGKKNKGRFNLCIVDGDYVYPKSPAGTNVAAPIIKCDEDNPCSFSHSHIIDCYSVENMIPPSLYASIDPSLNNQPWFSKIKAAAEHPSWNYIPLKKGKACDEFSIPKDPSGYWKNISSRFTPTSGKCKKIDTNNPCNSKCTVFDKIGEDYAYKFLLRISDTALSELIKSNPAVVEEIPPHIFNELQKIGDKITWFGCSGAKIRA